MTNPTSNPATTMHNGEKTQPIVHEFIEQNAGLHAYIVIDSLQNGRSCGGLRIADDLTVEEIKALAHSMTLKYNFLQRTMGGAKAGIILPTTATFEQRRRALEAFGRQAESLLKNRTYIPWTDIGSSLDDIAVIMHSAGCDFHGFSDSSYFTALTVVSAVKAACETKDIDLTTATIIIEGFGKVGVHTASELTKFGARIIGVSTAEGRLYDASGLDINKLIELKKTFKDDIIHRYKVENRERKDRLLEMNTDILVPCARTWSINASNMKNIKAKIIAPGANNPLTEEAEKYLYHHGVLCLPDFICNIGGIFGTSLYDNGNQIPTVHKFIMNEYGLLVKEIICKSAKEKLLPSEVAHVIAEENQAASHQGTHYRSRKKNSMKWLEISYAQQFIPGLRARASLRNQRRIFTETITRIKDISTNVTLSNRTTI